MRIVCTTFILALVLLGCKGSEPEQQIVFASKSFYDDAKTNGSGMIYVAGTLTGEDLGYKNNSTVVACYADRMECLTYSVEQIGPNLIGRLDMPVSYPVIKWNSDEIVASGQGDWINCNKVTISIIRKSETTIWVTEPINQSNAQCRNSNTKILKWSIEDPPFWKATLRK
jgi:hypothetical protein